MQMRETQGPRPFTSLQDLVAFKILPPKALETLAAMNLRG
jgi:DNA uptake protein ComE-like DNA-binding protein